MLKGVLRVSLLFALPSFAGALEVAPWFGPEWEFNLHSNYTYSRFTRVQNGYPQLSSPSNDQRLAFSLEVPPSSSWDVALEAEFVDTPRQRWGWRSTAGQLRYLWLDDVAGAPISLMTGVNMRVVSRHSLHDVSAPYHGRLDFEATIAVGKEWSRGPYWIKRVFGCAGLGNATEGAPWLRTVAAFEGNYSNRHRYQLFAVSYWGFGGRRLVDVEQFDGYAHIRHQSIDLGGGYSYHFPIWGTLSCTCAVRVYARSFPEYVRFIALTYKLPFAFF